MNDRPVEELIGWRPYGHASWPWRDATDERRERAEVDDLAAWLDEHTATWELARTVVPPTGQPHRTWCVDPPHRFTTSYPTIRDALIAAVRKVAEQ